MTIRSIRATALLFCLSLLIILPAPLSASETGSLPDGWFADGMALSFDNMQRRAIKGTVDWERYEIVLDVPDRSVHLAFGILLDGRGQVWIDNIRFEVVKKEVARTNENDLSSRYPSAPVSLDFE
jgi:hypothetical protein